jgi:hypothetical protein
VIAVRKLTSAFELCQELEKSGDAPVLYVYEKSTGVILFAIFTSRVAADRGIAGEVLTCIEIPRLKRGWIWDFS